MKQLYKYLMLAAAGMSAALSANAQWEKCFSLPMSYGVHATSKGTLVANVYDYDCQGDIYYSEDNGDTWNASEAMDFRYGDFIDCGKYCFFAAEGYPRVARSSNGGKTWTIINYRSYIKDLLKPYEKDFANEELPVGAGGITFDPERNRVYIAFQGCNVGVLYTDDWGVTWKRTNPEGLFLPASPEQGINEDFIDFYYNIHYFKGKVYACGMYRWFEYDADKDEWTVVPQLDENGKPSVFVSNFLCAVTDDGETLYAGRAMEGSADPAINHYPDFILRTTDCRHFTSTKYPEGENQIYIRSLHHDGQNLFCTVKNKAIYVSPDGGETWTDFSEGLPHYFIPNFCHDEKYVYMACYRPNGSEIKEEGIYRLPIEKIYDNVRPSEDAIEEVVAPKVSVAVSGSELTVDGTCFAISIFDASGRLHARIEGANSVNIAALPAGVYIYNIIVPGDRIVGKFTK